MNTLHNEALDQILDEIKKEYLVDSEDFISKLCDSAHERQFQHPEVPKARQLKSLDMKQKISKLIKKDA